MAGLALGVIGVLSLIMAQRIPAAAASVMLAGLGFSAIFPIIVGWMTHCFGPTGNRLAGWAFVSASLGGATLPWLVGQLGNVAGDLRVGYGVPLAGILVLLILVPKSAKQGAA
jgi:fucose permease